MTLCPQYLTHGHICFSLSLSLSEGQKTSLTEEKTEVGCQDTTTYRLSADQVQVRGSGSCLAGATHCTEPGLHAGQGLAA